jgi:hypothetical protein
MMGELIALKRRGGRLIFVAVSGIKLFPKVVYEDRHNEQGVQAAHHPFESLNFSLNPGQPFTGYKPLLKAEQFFMGRHVIPYGTMQCLSKQWKKR